MSKTLTIQVEGTKGWLKVRHYLIPGIWTEEFLLNLDEIETISENYTVPVDGVIPNGAAPQLRSGRKLYLDENSSINLRIRLGLPYDTEIAK